MMSSNYLLEWPGMAGIPFVIIDPLTKVMFSKDKPLPVEQQNLDVFENKYVKLSSILDLFSDQVEQDAQWMLQELLERFNVKKLINVTTTSSSQKTVTTYLPVTTLLALVMIWPCCKVFQAIKKSVCNYLNTYSDTICIECGWAQKECVCDKMKNNLFASHVVGYGVQKVERGCQTTEFKQKSILNNVHSNVNYPPKPQEMHQTNIAYLIPQSVVIPSQISLQVVQPQMLSKFNSQIVPNDVWINNKTNINCQNEFRSPTTPQNITQATLVTNSYNNMVTPPSPICSNPTQSSKPSTNNGSNIVEPSNNEDKSEVSTNNVNYIRPLSNSAKEQNTSTSSTNKDVTKLSFINISKHGFYYKSSQFKKRKLENSDMEAIKYLKTSNKNKKFKADDGKDYVNKNNALAFPKNNNNINAKAFKNDSVSCNSNANKNEIENDDKDLGKKTIKLWKLIDDCYSDDNNDEDADDIDNSHLKSKPNNNNSKAVLKNNNQNEKDDDDDEDDEGSLKIDETRDTNESKQVDAKHDDNQMVNNVGDSKVKKIFAKFQYIPTGEHIFRCTITKCGQCFDTRKAANLHCYVHANDEPSTQLQSNNVDNSKKVIDILNKNNDNADKNSASNAGQKQSQFEISSSTSNSQYQCHKCNFKAPFFHWYDLLRHLRTSHELIISKEPNSCKYCGLHFESYDQLTSHMDYHYSNRYKCIHCGLLLLTWKQVQRHLETCENRSRRSTSSVNLGCPYCTFVFHKKNIRNLHLLSHSDVGLSCAVCQDEVAWVDWKSLRKHYQQKHAKLLLGKITPHRRDLPIKHKPPKCKRCDVEFKNFELFSNHMYRAHDLVPYTLIECAQCEKHFRTEKSHDWHVKHVHVQEITCEKCSYVTTSKSLLKLHMTQKHSEKQHTCSECDKSFTYFQQLRVHMAHHARKTIFACQDCDMEFTRNSDLRTHQQQEHSEIYEKAPENCPECEFRCFSRQTLNVHIRKNHPDFVSTYIDESDDPPPTTTANMSTTAATIHKSSHDHHNTRPSTPPTIPSSAAQSVESRDVPSKKSSLSTTLNISSVSKRGRKRKMSSKIDWDHVEDEYSGDERKDKKKVDKVHRDSEDRIRKLRKSSCARTRNFDEHKADKNAYTYDGGFTFDHEKALGPDVMLIDDMKATSSPSTASINDEGSGLVPADAINFYPYLDHSYFKFDTSTIGLDNHLSSSSSTTVVAKVPSSIDKRVRPSNSSNLITSDPNNQQTSHSSTSSAHFSYRTTRRQVALASNNDSNRLTNCYSPPDIVSSIVPVQPMMKTQVQPMDLTNELTDVDIMAESELLKSTGGYCLVQDILLKSSPGKSAQRCLEFNDDDENEDAGIGDEILNNTMTDLNEIDLCEDDLNMFQGQLVLSIGDKEKINDASSFLQRLNTTDHLDNEFENMAIVASAPNLSLHVTNSLINTNLIAISSSSSHDKNMDVAKCISTPKSFIHSSRVTTTNIPITSLSKHLSTLTNRQPHLNTKLSENLFENLIGTTTPSFNAANNNHIDEQEQLDVSNVNDDSNNCPNLDDVDTSGLLSFSGSNNSFELFNFIDGNKK